MRKRVGSLTPKERVLAKEIGAHGDIGYASRKAGYAFTTAATKALSRTDVQAEIRRVQLDRMLDEALPLAVDCIVGLLKDKNAPAGARVSAAKLTFDQVAAQSGIDPMRKEPHEMSADELARAIEIMEAHRVKIADKAKVIEPSIFD